MRPAVYSSRSTPGSLRAQHELLLQRRILEEQRHSTLNKYSMDMQKAEKDAAAYGKLVSDRTFKSSVDNYLRQQITDRKESDMQLRRTELSILLHEEENQYQAELAEHIKDIDSQQMQEMKQRVEKLRQARMKQQEQIVSEKLHEVWKRNCPELRETVSKQIDLETAKAWGDQIQIRQQNEEEDRRMEQHAVACMKEELERAKEKDQDRQQLEQSRMKQMTQVWEEQIDSLRKHEEQMKQLQQQEREYLRQLSELAALEDQRKKLEDIEKKKDLGRSLVKQHAAHIRRRNRQVQESIDFDRQLLDQVNKMEQQSMVKDQQRKEYARTVAAQMKETMENRLRIEKEREREIDRLDREEAKLYWEKREHEWTAEEEARTSLVNEVIGDLRNQIRMKMSANRQAQEEVEKGREELSSMMKLSEMEKQKQLDHICRAQMVRREDLDAQVRELDEKQRRERDVALTDHTKRQMDQRNYDNFLARETAKLGIGSNSAAAARRCQSAASMNVHPSGLKSSFSSDYSK